MEAGDPATVTTNRLLRSLWLALRTAAEIAPWKPSLATPMRKSESPATAPGSPTRTSRFSSV